MDADQAGDLAHLEGLGASFPGGQAEADTAVGELIFEAASGRVLIALPTEAACRLRAGAAFAVGEEIEAGLGEVVEEFGRPAAAVEADRQPPFPDQLPQFRQQPAQLGHHSQRLPARSRHWIATAASRPCMPRYAKSPTDTSRAGTWRLLSSRRSKPSTTGSRK